VCGDVARFLADTTERWDGVVVNPPRRGLSPEVRARVAALGAHSVAYVSCNPETLARDLAHFAWLGLGAQRVLPLDMIPLTEEVESFVSLAPVPLPTPRVLHQDADLVVIDKPAHDPTLRRPERTSSLLGRVRALPGCERATPLDLLDGEISGVCVFARSPAAAARWSPASAAAARRYVALARGIWSARGAVKRGRAGESAPRTRYRRLEVALGQSLLEITPSVGDKQQIRRHLASIGHPLVGDSRHGHAATNRHFAERYGLDRTFLHCARIEIAIPGQTPLVFEAPLAGDLASVLAHGKREPSRGPDR
jgi:23S rRNA (uracil1939-C5)-methyltransferase